MRSRHSAALVRHELRILRHDPLPFILSFIIPLVMMWLLRPAFQAVFTSVGGPADGSVQAVPGMVILYAMFLIANIAFGFLREQEWRTWVRLRAAGASAAELTVGKLVPGFAVVTALMVVLFVAGAILFDVRVRGSVAAAVALLALFGAWLTTAGALVAGLCRTAPQATAVANLLSLVVGGLGGVLIPVETLPGWVQATGRANPAWWAMRGLRETIVGTASPIAEIMVLAAWTVVTGAVAIAVIERRYGGDVR